MTCRLFRPSESSSRDSFLLRNCSQGYGVGSGGLPGEHRSAGASAINIKRCLSLTDITMQLMGGMQGTAPEVSVMHFPPNSAAHQDALSTERRTQSLVQDCCRKGSTAAVALR